MENAQSRSTIESGKYGDYLWPKEIPIVYTSDITPLVRIQCPDLSYSVINVISIKPQEMDTLGVDLCILLYGHFYIVIYML